jgi:2-desacetyl-2-hydroxyethyl bacteriochlorophyllide A dehydrogenase
MKVLKVIQPFQFEFEEQPIPVPAFNEALLKMEYCGICGSDVKVFTGKHPYGAFPRIPGHEISATLIQMGNEIIPQDKRMTVSVNPYFTCGRCSACIGGKRNCCLRNQTMGVQRDGAYSEYITVPIDKIIINKFNLESKLLALSEPYGVALHSVIRADVRKNDKVMIFGAGPIGIFCLMASISRGALVSIADPHNEKLQIAMSLGAEDYVNVKSSDMNGFYQASTWGAGYDICIDATGSKEAIKYCFEFVKTGGKIVFVGHSKEEMSMPHSDIIKKELTIFASRNSIEIEQSQEEIKNHSMIDKVITDIVPFEKVPEFYKRFEAKDGSIIKALIEF